MSVIGSRASLAATLAAGLFATISTADAQVRRNLGGGGDSNPTTPPASTAPETADAPDTAKDGDEDREDQPPVDPRRVAQMVETRGPMWLLEQKPVREELGIEDEQFDQLKKVDEAVQKHRRDSFSQMREQMELMRQQGGPGGFGGGPGGFGGGPGGPQFDAFRTMMAQSQVQAEQAFASVLSKAQVKRYKQLILQAKGPMVVTEPEMMVTLKLTDYQQQRIGLIVQELESKQQASRQSRMQLFMSMRNNAQRGGGQPGGQPNRPDPRQGRETAAARPDAARPDAARPDAGNEQGGDRNRGRFEMTPEVRERFDQIREQSDSIDLMAIGAVGKVLTKSQVSKFKTMLGEPFDFSTLSMQNTGGGWGDRGGRGGDRGGRGGDRG